MALAAARLTDPRTSISLTIGVITHPQFISPSPSTWPGSCDEM
jgi:hypothetical protein